MTDDLHIPEFLKRKQEGNAMKEEPPDPADNIDHFDPREITPTLDDLIKAAKSLSERIAADKETLSKLKKKIQSMIGSI